MVMNQWRIGSGVTCAHLNRPSILIAGHPIGLKRTEGAWANTLCNRSIPLDALVCWACVRFIRHHTGETGVSPRWAPKERHQMCCIVEGCGEVSHTSTTIATHNIAREYLDIVETADSDSSALALCNPHYQHLYRALRFPLPCAACASQPRYGGDYTRRCPNPTEITRYLQQMVDFDGILSSDSKVCKQCYDFHQQVLHLHNSPQSTPVLALDDIVAQLEGKIEQLEGSKNELISDKEYLGWVVCKVTIKRGGGIKGKGPAGSPVILLTVTAHVIIHIRPTHVNRMSIGYLLATARGTPSNNSLQSMASVHKEWHYSSAGGENRHSCQPRNWYPLQQKWSIHSEKLWFSDNSSGRATI